MLKALEEKLGECEAENAEIAASLGRRQEVLRESSRALDLIEEDVGGVKRENESLKQTVFSQNEELQGLRVQGAKDREDVRYLGE